MPIATHLLALAVGAVLGKLLSGKVLSGRRVGAHKKHQKVWQKGTSQPGHVAFREADLGECLPLQAFVLTVQYGFENVAARDKWGTIPHATCHCALLWCQLA